MKRILYSLLMFVALFDYALAPRLKAQGSGQEEHLTFKTVPITGTAETMVNALRMQGCTYVDGTTVSSNGQEARIDVLWGSLIGFDRVYMVVYSTATVPNYAFMCQAAFPCAKDWDVIIGIYNFILEKLTRKYGLPLKVNHYCPVEDIPYATLSECRFQSLVQGKCTWSDTWETELGVVKLEIGCQGSFAIDDSSPEEIQYGVILTYLDAVSIGKASELDEL